MIYNDLGVVSQGTGRVGFKIKQTRHFYSESTFFPKTRKVNLALRQQVTASTTPPPYNDRLITHLRNDIRQISLLEWQLVVLRYRQVRSHFPIPAGNLTGCRISVGVTRPLPTCRPLPTKAPRFLWPSIVNHWRRVPRLKVRQ